MPSPSKTKINISFLAVLTIPIILLFVLLAGLVSYFSFKNGQRAVGDVVFELRSEITSRIDGHLHTFLSTPHLINQINANAIQQGIVEHNDLAALEKYFWEQIQLFETSTSIYFGNLSGGLVDAGREGAEGFLYVIVTDDFQRGTFKKYSADSEGNRSELLATIPNFDARTRPWYTNAVEKEAATWSKPYILFTGQDMAISASLPVYNQNGNVLGVLANDIFLSHLSDYLQTLDFGKSGQGFIIDRSGLLIASSTNEAPFNNSTENETLVRLDARDSSSPIIRYAAQYLNENIGDYQNITTISDFEFEIDGNRQLLQVTPYQDEYDIDWLIVVVIPESDFMAQIEANNQITGLMIVAALALIIGLGIIFTQRLTRPITYLKDAAQAVARGEWRQIEKVTRIRETRELTQAFNDMTVQLEEAIENLNAEIDERKYAEEALIISETQLREVINSMEKAIAIYEPVENGDDFVFVDMNEFGEKITHYKIKDVIGKKLSELFPGEASVGIIEKLRETWQTGQSTQIPLKQYVDDRITQWVENYIFKLPSGKVVAMFEDTFEKHKAEIALRESQERFRQFFETSAQYCYMVSPDGKIADINQSALNILGYRKDDIVGKSLIETIYSPESHDKAKKLFGSWIETGSIKNEELEIQLKSGKKRTILLNVEAIRDEDENIIHSASVQMDITERKKAEEMLQTLNDELEQRVQERTAEQEKIIKLMAGREVRMVELKKVIKKLREQLADAGIDPVLDDPLNTNL
jgi:PAS domain S-box-containing protein